ncbi:unnamed protein product [Lathyrus sativus]|nr:unnamed protein product [Lathyrus sativus]
MQMPDFNIDDLLAEQPSTQAEPLSRQEDPPTTHHDEYMSPNSSQSPTTNANEHVGRGYRQKMATRCGTGGHF